MGYGRKGEAVTTLNAWVPATEQLPTMLGYVDGIVSLDPLVLQCRACGSTYTSHGRVGFSIILSGSGFHRCDPGAGRLCPGCLNSAKSACGGGHR